MADSYQTIIKDFSKSWGPRVDEFNDSFEVLAGGISALSDPKRMALVAAVSGFAGTLASGIAGALPELIWNGGEAIVEWITHRNADRLDHGMVRSLLGTGGSEGIYSQVQQRVRNLSQLLRSSVSFLKLAQGPSSPELARLTSPKKDTTDLATEFASLQVRQDILEAQYQKAIESGDSACALSTRVESNALEKQIAGFEGLMEAVDTLSIRSTESISQDICQNLQPLWSELAKAMGELQYLRGKILEAQTGFFSEEVKRTSKESRKAFQAAREDLKKTQKKREKGAEKSYTETSFMTRLWDKLYDDSLRDLKVASGMKDVDIELRSAKCLEETTKKLGRPLNRDEAHDCWMGAIREAFTGDYGQEKKERFEQHLVFFRSMEGLMAQQEQILTELRPENEIQEAMLIAYAEQFTRIAFDQRDAEKSARELGAFETEFASLCSQAQIPDWNYTSKFGVPATK